MNDALRAIKLIVLDVDGVICDSIILINGSMEAKTFNTQDGFGVTMARHAGIKMAILTGRECAAVKARAETLTFDYYEAGHFYKEDALKKIMQHAGVTKHETLYMGDDVLDLICKEHVGVFVGPANAARRVKEEADFITQARGGHGAVRELIETVLHAQGILEQTETHFIGEH